jgi:ABC-type oligopeptide transport system substrate-binding subunit
MGFLNAVGIRVQAEVLDTTAARVRDQDGKYELSISSLGGEGHPLIFLQRGFHSRFAGPAGNTTRYRNPVVDQLLDRAAAARDTRTMLRLVQDAERIVVDDAPWSPILHLKGVMVKQPYVRGLRPISIDMDWQPLEEVWLAWEPKRR